MSKISEQKALEAYPIINPPYNTNIEAETNVKRAFNREGYIKGYDQAMKDVMKHAEELQFRSDDWGYAYGCGYKKAMQDIQEQAEKLVIEKSNGEVTIEDLVAYNQGFKTGRELAMQDFLEKACEWWGNTLEYNPGTQHIIKSFKDYMQNQIIQKSNTNEIQE